MIKHGRCTLLIIASVLLLSGCLGNIWTGAALIYDRHNVYKKLDDYQLAANANKLLFDDDKRILKQRGCSLDMAVFNGDVLIAGHVPSEDLRELINSRLNHLTGYRELFKQVAVSEAPSTGLEDSWITTKIKAQIIADSAIDPNIFKILTIDRIVYVMGDVPPSQADQVLKIASNTSGVIRVVKLLRYYNLSETPVAATGADLNHSDEKICGLLKKRPQCTNPIPGSG
ncbi:BON domain-containing protein [Legionella dresdenensis]|uniref:BON domain-containing protein n=1 Tax=Legionella dresdenensis TaxID=450200 RepID=A0ABV8CD15_9GAMM